ncbi:MAG: SDR family oxidoreductase [Kiritimatiellae bacterium]|nr:SDR family oxidoreductase [Kiritimatiellia bacterium]
MGQAICADFEAAGALVYPTDCVPCDMARFIPGDLGDPSFPRTYVEQVQAETGRIDVLVNNAGICPRTPLPEIGEEEWARVLSLNLGAGFFLSQVCIEVMMTAGSGAIINMASMAGRMGGIAVGAHYSASKAALICLTKTMARHGASRGVRVNAVAPGVIDTSMTSVVDDAAKTKLLDSIPLGRFGSPQDVAAAVLFLSSQDAAYITGTTLDVNGGQLMNG